MQACKVLAFIFSLLLWVPQAAAQQTLRLALYHSAPVLGDIQTNLIDMQKAISLAAEHRADGFITPELSLTGYHFKKTLPLTDIEKTLPTVLESLQSSAQQHGITVFLSHIDVWPDNGKQFFNTLFVIGDKGELLGKHNKINTIPQSEDWSVAGQGINAVTAMNKKIGLLICADAWPQSHTQKLAVQGVELIISSANWAPGQYGPGDSWKNRSRQIAGPLVVVNRSGSEGALDFSQAQSVIAIDGSYAFSASSDGVRLHIVDLDLQAGEVSPVASIALEKVKK